jgi:hypothetical protein
VLVNYIEASKLILSFDLPHPKFGPENDSLALIIVWLNGLGTELRVDDISQVIKSLKTIPKGSHRAACLFVFGKRDFLTSVNWQLLSR